MMAPPMLSSIATALLPFQPFPCRDKLYKIPMAHSINLNTRPPPNIFVSWNQSNEQDCIF